MFIYPFLAVFWSALGLTILVWHWADPHARFFENFGSAVVAGWVAVALGIYNLVRWWGTMAGRRLREETTRLRERDKIEGTTTAQLPDPTFDFGRQDKRGRD